MVKALNTPPNSPVIRILYDTYIISWKGALTMVQMMLSARLGSKVSTEDLSCFGLKLTETRLGVWERLDRK